LDEAKVSKKSITGEHTMKKLNFDRRSVLKGLLAVPGAAAMGGLMSSCAKNGGNTQPKPEAARKISKTALAATTIDFSVVLHGTYALQFDTQNKQVQILIPTVLEGDGTEAHKYLSGLFLNEKPFITPSAPIVFGLPLNANNPLPDVVTKAPTEDPTKFVILRKQDLQQQPSGSGPLRNIFQLPYPRSLKVLRAQEFKPQFTANHKFFDNATLIPRTPTQVPLSLALQYDLGVEGPFPVPNIHYHIFAEPQKKPGQPHIMTAFSALTSLYVDVAGLKMSDDILNDIDKPPSKSLVRDVTTILLPNGFDAKEPISLEQRAGLGLPTGAVHVGACGGLILVSGPDA
jgi:hypothetical protein